MIMLMKIMHWAHNLQISNYLLTNNLSVGALIYKTDGRLLANEKTGSAYNV